MSHFTHNARDYLAAMADTLDAYVDTHLAITPDDIRGIARELREIARTLAPGAHITVPCSPLARHSIYTITPIYEDDTTNVVSFNRLKGKDRP